MTEMGKWEEKGKTTL